MPTNNERIITYPNYIREYRDFCNRHLLLVNKLKTHLESKNDPALMKEIEGLPPIISKLTKRIELLSALEATF